MNELQTVQATTLFPTPAEWNMLKEQATMAVKSGFLPIAIKTAEQATIIALKGRELGIPPMHAFSHIHVIQGRPTVSAELMLSLIFKNCPGAKIHYQESTEARCSIEAARPGQKSSTFSFTIEEAKKAGLLSKTPWQNFPAAMLRARVISIVGRAVFPDAIMGCSYTHEEMGAEVDEDGAIIDSEQEDTERLGTIPPVGTPKDTPIAQPKQAIVLPKQPPVQPRGIGLGMCGEVERANMTRLGNELGLDAHDVASIIQETTGEEKLSQVPLGKFVPILQRMEEIARERAARG